MATDSTALSLALSVVSVISVVVCGLMNVVTGSAIGVPSESVRLIVAWALSHSELLKPRVIWEIGTAGDI